ncbi:MAG TPA: YdcF family protein [Magnetospirillum sp.]|jgi:uncharacterized SAM-binding protein YcdF (DUF218 family)|nr:YdcF family protein [Magnetospirillum sp.]
MSASSVDAYDVAIILGARIEPDGSPSPAMARRVAHGVELLRQGRARALLMTGGPTTASTPEARAMHALALALGADPDRVHLEERARNTIENALLSVPLVRRHGWRRLLVVTDSFHCLRSYYIFRRLGLPAVIAGVRPLAPTAEWWLAHLREAAALPWTVLRVERRLWRLRR